MKEKMKYFILNNAYDFKRGSCENMVIADNHLLFASDRPSGIGRYLTRLFDSGDTSTIWHRLLLHTENCSADEIRMTVYAADHEQFSHKGEQLRIDDVLHDKTLTLDEKRDVLSAFVKKRVNGAKDALLHDVTGRYVWVYVEIFGISDKPAVIHDLLLYLPAESWIDYLPQIYRKSDAPNGFLERYLGIFQTLYEEINDDIRRISDRFDPECAEKDFLPWLAQWLDLSNSAVWEEEKLRKLLLKAVQLYRSRGTRESLSAIIELYTGEKPFIVENIALQEHIGTQTYEKSLLPMYGDDPYKIWVLIRREVIRSNRDVDILWNIAREMMPVTVDFELKILEPFIFLGQYSYLGINSYLSKPRSAILDGNSRLTFSVIGE